MAKHHTKEAMKLLTDLRMADDFYFNKSKPRMSDSDYDKMRDKLSSMFTKGIEDKALETAAKAYLSGTGILPSGSGKKVDLALPMPSLDKIKNDAPEELTKWVDSVCKHANTFDFEFISSPKLDGSSLRLAYDVKNLEFLYATTRGDGVIGRDVTAQARALIEAGKIPARLKPHQDLAKMKKMGEKIFLIRCEIMISTAAFKKWEGKNVNGTVLKESRNAVNGFINATKTFSTKFASSLDVFALTIVTKKMPAGFCKKTTQLQLLADSGFTTYRALPGFGRFHRDACNLVMLDVILEQAIKGPYTCDGIVVEVNEHLIRHQLDKGAKRPIFARAFKLSDSASGAAAGNNSTKMTHIEWRPSKDGKQVPLAHYLPVRFGNVTNTKASAVHADHVKKLGLGKGAVIEVVRAGEVIPKIIKVTKKSTDKLPKKCACGAKLVYIKPNLYCSKPAKCKVAERLRLEASIKTLGIPGLAGKKIEQLYNAGYTDVKKLALINAVKLASLDGWGMGTAHKIVGAIRKQLPSLSISERMDLSNAFMSPGFALSGSRLDLIADNLKVKTILTADAAMMKRIKKKLGGVKGLGDGAVKVFIDNLSAFQKFNRSLKKNMTIAGIKKSTKE